MMQMLGRLGLAIGFLGQSAPASTDVQVPQARGLSDDTDERSTQEDSDIRVLHPFS